CTRPRYSCAFAASARNTPSSKKRAVRSQIDFIGIPRRRNDDVTDRWRRFALGKSGEPPINPNSAPYGTIGFIIYGSKVYSNAGENKRAFLELVCTLRHSSLQFVEEIQ